MEKLFETERLIVRSFRDTDAPALYENHLDNEVKKWLPNECYADEKEALEAIRFYAECVDQGRLPFVLGAELKATGELIGDAGISGVEGRPQEVEVGYCIGKKYRLHGYAAELLRGISGYIASRFGISVIYGRVVHGNEASQRVLENARFSLKRKSSARRTIPMAKECWFIKRSCDFPVPVRMLCPAAACSER